MHLRRLFVVLTLSAIACNVPLATATPPATATATIVPTPSNTLTPTPTQTSTPTVTAEFVSGLPDPAGYRWSPVVDGLDRPLAITQARDDRLFVVEQRGIIWVVREGIRQEEPYLDIRDRVNSGAFEQGLLGLAFDPEFSRTGHLYVNYTDSGGDTVVSRFTAGIGEDQVDPASEFLVMRFDQPFRNHNGGDLQFGPDGYLYIATGDGGSGGDPHVNGQSLDTLLGKLLRIDVSGAEPYAIPGDNPFAAGAGRPEIWLYGLRNPWRFSFDPATGDLYIGDVGQNAWEEIDYLAAGSPGGANFGWNIREGMHPFAGQRTEGLIDPVAEYPNSAMGCSVTGGIVVRDPALPAWRGVYLYGDYCSGRVWGLLREAGGGWQNSLLFQTPHNISSFGAGSDGVVYLADHRGAIYRLEQSP